jgi:hypothetical protein
MLRRKRALLGPVVVALAMLANSTAAFCLLNFVRQRWHLVVRRTRGTSSRPVSAGCVG